MTRSDYKGLGVSIYRPDKSDDTLDVFNINYIVDLIKIHYNEEYNISVGLKFDEKKILSLGLSKKFTDSFILFLNNINEFITKLSNKNHLYYLEYLYKKDFVDVTIDIINIIILKEICLYCNDIFESISKSYNTRAIESLDDLYSYISAFKNYYNSHFDDRYKKNFHNEEFNQSFIDMFSDNYNRKRDFNAYILDYVRKNVNYKPSLMTIYDVAKQEKDDIIRATNYDEDLTNILLNIQQFKKALNTHGGLRHTVTSLFYKFTDIGGGKQNEIIKTKKRVTIYYDGVKYKRNILIKNNKNYVKINNKLVLI